jgi:hypothetical protein
MAMGPAKGKFAKNRTCSVEGCDRRHFGHGFCQLHYQRWISNGDPLIVRGKAANLPVRKIRSVEDRARDKFTPGAPDECWPWAGTKTHDGYGTIAAKYRPLRHVYAHRLVFEMYGGVIPDGYEVDHLCRNPTCVNPAHLEPVTHAENMHRAGLEHDPVTGVFRRPTQTPSSC